MTRHLSLCAVVLLLLTSPMSVRADVPNPSDPNRNRPAEPAEHPTAALTIKIDEGVREPRLEIPRKLLATWAADKDTQGALQPSRTYTMLSGVALALAFACGGLWLARQGDRMTGRGLALLLGAITFLSIGGSAAWADRAVKPKESRSNNILFDKTVVEIVEKGEAITLTANREHLAKIASLAKKEAQK